MEIPITILNKYYMASLDEYKLRHGDNIDTEITFYQTFLIQTDHIPNKIIEAQILNKEIKDYTEILNYRQIARNKINELYLLV